MSSNGHNSEPLTAVGDGRDAGGKFAPGNRFAKGNPHAARVQEIRTALMEACDPASMKAAALQIVEQAKAGDLRAFAELLDRTIGKAVAADLEERLTALEAAIQERHAEAR